MNSECESKRVKSIEWNGVALRLLDQTKLPNEVSVLICTDYQAVADAIRSMKVRGAPAIGAAAAYGIVLGARALSQKSKVDFMAGLEIVAKTIEKTRPTAVNLFWALRRMKQVVESLQNESVADIIAALEAEADAIAEEDIDTCRRIGANGAELLESGSGVLTHCNAGSLATVDYGTALGVVRSAWAQGREIHVYVDETRPFLQGARLTAWELVRDGIPATLITDNMAGWLMKLGRIKAAIVGADRIAANGDTANKIGTYSVACLCKEHGIPFYVAAPLSTIDTSIPSGDGIPIEERGKEEVTHIFGHRIAPDGVEVFNPAFDVTPAKYITAIITELGIIRAPYKESIAHLVNAKVKGTQQGE